MAAHHPAEEQERHQEPTAAEAIDAVPQPHAQRAEPTERQLPIVDPCGRIDGVASF